LVGPDYGFWGSGVLGFWGSGVLGFWGSGVLVKYFKFELIALYFRKISTV